MSYVSIVQVILGGSIGTSTYSIYHMNLECDEGEFVHDDNFQFPFVSSSSPSAFHVKMCSTLVWTVVGFINCRAYVTGSKTSFTTYIRVVKNIPLDTEN